MKAISRIAIVTGIAAISVTAIAAIYIMFIDMENDRKKDELVDAVANEIYATVGAGVINQNQIAVAANKILHQNKQSSIAAAEAGVSVEIKDYGLILVLPRGFDNDEAGALSSRNVTHRPGRGAKVLYSEANRQGA